MNAIVQWFRKPRLRWFFSRPSDTNFRDSPPNVVWANQLLYGQQGRQLQAYLLDGLPKQAFYPGDKITMEQAALEYMRITGYLECFKRLQDSAAEIPHIEGPLEADYNQDPSEGEQT